MLMPISGPGSYFGVMGKEGIDLALEQVGKTDLKGYRLQVQYEDSACSPLQATNTVKRVLDQFKPHIVIGEECSDASLAIAPILEQAKVVQLNAGSVTMKLTESGYKYVFRIFPNAEQQSAPLVKVALQHLKAKTAVVLHEKTNAGVDNGEGFKKAFEAAGRTQQVHGHGFGGRHDELMGMVAEGSLDGQRFRGIVDGRRGPMGVDVVHDRRGHRRGLECGGHGAHRAVGVFGLARHVKRVT